MFLIIQFNISSCWLALPITYLLHM